MPKGVKDALPELAQWVLLAARHQGQCATLPQADEEQTKLNPFTKYELVNCPAEELDDNCSILKETKISPRSKCFPILKFFASFACLTSKKTPQERHPLHSCHRSMPKSLHTLLMDLDIKTIGHKEVLLKREFGTMSQFSDQHDM